ncbi:MAG: PBP1A family penicillin-binding protein [Candidatus Aquicultorales bacterium]
MKRNRANITIRSRRKGRFGGLLRGPKGFFLLSLAGLALIVGAAYPILDASLPDISDVNELAKRQTTVVYAADGSNLTEIYKENRTIIPLAKISVHLRKAVVGIEDERFYGHGGLDYLGILRALVRDVTSGEMAEGGSTITQQYVKNAYFSPKRTLTRKIKEAVLASRLERTLSKDEILERYLNTIYLGDGAYGVETASRTYFDKPASDLNLEESALLAGLIQAPESYNPRREPKVAIDRRNTVLTKLSSLGTITKKQAAEARSRPLNLAPPKTRVDRAPYFVEWVKKTLADRFGDAALYSQGLRIYTTLDPAAQEEAERTVRRHLGADKDPEAAVVAVDPESGAVKAMVGGKDFGRSKFNTATQGMRQPGSAFKPFVLATALSKGTPPSMVFDGSSPKEFKLPGGKTWRVKNYSESSGGRMDLWTATALSSNVVFADLILKVGPEKVAETAKKLGIKGAVNPDPAIALGGLEEGVTPLDMASAFGSFANEGNHLEPYGIARVTTADGKSLFEHKPKPRRVMDEGVAFLVTKALRNVINWGTGQRAYIDRPSAGKTGTTDNHSDAWFVGYTPDLSVAVWVGYPDSNRPMNDVQGITVTGGSIPAEIWADFMNAFLGDREVRRFSELPADSLTTREICVENGKLASEYCPDVRSDYFIKGFQPKDYCADHEGVVVPDVVGKPVDEAVRRLEAEGLKYSIERRVSSEPPETVINQTPGSGARIKEGGNVTLVVSAGETIDPSSTEETATPPSE